MMHQFSKSPANSGFTLVETLVAIAILMIAVVGPYYSIQQAITTSYIARDQLIATQLAQEGEEFIYYVRDKDYLLKTELGSNVTWLFSLDPCFSTTGCTVDPPLTTITQCPQNGVCPPLLFNTDLQYYTQSGNYAATRFTRTVVMRTVGGSGNQVEVKVTVSWVSHNRTYSVSTTEELYNWL